MTNPVETGELSLDRLELAWPLIREIAEGVSLESWCAFARSMIDPMSPPDDRRGIVVAQRRRVIRGLMTYETVDELVRGRVLLLRNAVVMDIALGGQIATALHRRCDELAKNSGCASICLELAPQMTWIGDVWRDCFPSDALKVDFIEVVPPAAERVVASVASVSVT